MKFQFRRGSRRVGVVVLALWGALGCGTSDVARGQNVFTEAVPTKPDVPSVSEEGQPAATSSPNHAQSDSYVLRSNDLVKITVFQEDDLTTETRISSSGYITFPLIGPVKLAGKSVAEATNEIRTRLDKDYIINPQVTLTLMEFAGQWVTVLGEVQKPGQVQIPPEGGLDLLGAIALAGGYTRVADPAHVIVRRNIDGQDRVLLVNAKRLSKDTTVPQFLVEPGDRISVGESWF